MITYKSIILLILIVIVLLPGCSESVIDEAKSGHSNNVASEVRLVSSEILVKGTFSNQIITNGTLRARDNIGLSFERKGIIKKIHCKNGMTVSQGQLLAEVFNDGERLSIAKAKETLKSAELELNSLLLGFGGVSGDTNSVDNNLLQNLKVQSGYTMALINLEIALNNLKSTYIYSPTKGIIADLNKNEFDIIAPNEVLCRVINNQVFLAEFSITEQELSNITTGQTVKIIPIVVDTISLKGTVQSINPIVDKNGFIKVWAVVRNPYYNTNSRIQIIDGMNIKIIIESHIDNVISVPKSSLVLRSNKYVVFTYNAGLAKWNYVETRSENSTHYLISKGLNDGDTIITSGNLYLTHDAPIQLNNN